MKKQVIFEGAATALVTPFENGAVDFASLDRLIEMQIAEGINALVICGTSGEASTLTDEEQIDTIAHAVRTVNGRVPVIAGTGSNDTRHGVNLCKEACRVGADALLIVTPYYNKTSQRGLVNLYEKIGANVDKPIIVYNVPSRTGLNIEPETYVKLADIDNVVAIKEANGNISKIADTAALVGDKLTIYSGNDDQIVPMLALGAKGVISVLSNVVPADTVRMCRAFFEGRNDEARELQLKYMPLIHALFSDVNPIPVKEAVGLLGWCSSEMREPLIGMEESKLNVLRAELRNAGLTTVR